LEKPSRLPALNSDLIPSTVKPIAFFTADVIFWLSLQV
jgi:hypothetical protein